MWKRLILRSFSSFSLLLAVVRQVVMAFGHVDELVRPVAAVVGEHERADARQVGLEGEHEHVGQQADVVRVFLRDALGLDRFGRRVELGRVFDARDPQFDLADGVEVLVELALVGGAELARELVGVLGDEIENALVVQFAFGAGLRRISFGSCLPKSRSNTWRGLTSLAIGVDSPRQEMLDE